MKSVSGTEIDDLSWQSCSPFTCQECKKVFWIYYTGEIKELKLVFCNDCFESDSKLGENQDE